MNASKWLAQYKGYTIVEENRGEHNKKNLKKWQS